VKHAKIGGLSKPHSALANKLSVSCIHRIKEKNKTPIKLNNRTLLLLKNINIALNNSY